MVLSGSATKLKDGPPVLTVAPQLRRSKRKGAGTCSPRCSPPPSTKKSKRGGKDWAFSKPPATMMTLPWEVQFELTRYLDVASLEALSQTCSHFDSLINGRYLTTINLPFTINGGFMNEIKKSKVIEKKALLRLECKKPRNDLSSLQEHLPSILSQDSHYSHSLYQFVDTCHVVKQYVLETQLDLLDLSKLRELDFVPENIRQEVSNFTVSMMECALSFDHIIASRLGRVGALANISRLDIMLGLEETGHDLWKKYLPSLNNLLELNIVVLERKAGAGQIQEYIYGYLEEIVSATKSPSLSLTVLSENKRIVKLPKVFCSDHIEYLHISAPCTLSLWLKMKKLTEVRLEMSETTGDSGDCCSYQGSRLDDRRLHRTGLCILHLGALHGHCPRLEKFNGIHIGQFSKLQRFPKWNAAVKKLFYNDYVNSGGTKELKDWSRKRWFCRQPPVPRIFGEERLPHHLRY